MISAQRFSQFCLFLAMIVGSILMMIPFFARAADGSGTMVTTSGTVVAGSTGNTITMVYTADEQMTNGDIQFTLPSGWATPQLSTGVAGKIDMTSDGTVGHIENTMDSITNWSDNSLLMSETADTTTKYAGTGSVRVDTALGLGTSRAFYNYGSAQDWSNYTTVGFWIRPSQSITLGQLTFLVSSSTSLPTGSGTVSYNVPAAPANQWTYVSIDLTSQSSSTRNSVRSFGFQIPLTVLSSYGFDNFILGPSTVPTIISGSTIEVPIINLPYGSSVTLNYGVGGGTSGVTAPTLASSYTFDVASRVSAAGTNTVGPSGAFTVIPDVTSQFYFQQQPTSIGVGRNSAFPDTLFRIGSKDQYNNLANFDYATEITMAMTAGPSGAQLLGTAARTVTAGVVNFLNMKVTTPGSGYQFSFSAPGVPTLNSGTYLGYGATVAQTASATVVAESGGTDTYTLVLSGQPSSDVVITPFNDYNQITMSPASLTFTTSNWNTPQTVTVGAIDDAYEEGNHATDILNLVSSSDSRYSGVIIDPVTVHITDND